MTRYGRCNQSAGHASCSTAKEHTPPTRGCCDTWSCCCQRLRSSAPPLLPPLLLLPWRPRMQASMCTHKCMHAIPPTTSDHPAPSAHSPTHMQCRSCPTAWQTCQRTQPRRSRQASASARSTLQVRGWASEALAGCRCPAAQAWLHPDCPSIAPFQYPNAAPANAMPATVPQWTGRMLLTAKGSKGVG